jgi:hypothetical protein
MESLITRRVSHDVAPEPIEFDSTGWVLLNLLKPTCVTFVDN